MKKGLFHLLVLLGTGLVGPLGCGSSEEATESPSRGAEEWAGTEAADSEIESWVDVYYPDAAQPGYNLILYRRRHPTLVDLNGRVVHSWPEIRAAGRARLLADGGMLVVAQDGAVREYSWEGEQRWEFRLEGENFPHHDLIQLANGSRLVLAHDLEERLDYLVEVTPGGEVTWEWHAAEHLADDLDRAGEVSNRTHINSIHELADNKWWAAGDERFRPGNLLLSARNLNTLYIIDKPTGRVVWSYYGTLDHQHEALMVPPGRPGAGNILVFNNGLKDLHVYRKSAILEIDPSDQSTVWTYETPSFFSSTGGTQQSLANGNLLITSSRGGRIFEINRSGKIVWQMSPSYKPMRVERYHYDHCPQLAALAPPRAERVERRNPRRHVDEDLYTFALPHQTRQIEVGDSSFRILKETEVCRRLLLPERPEMQIGYGVKPRKNQQERTVQVGVRVRLQAPGDEESRVLYSDDAVFDLGAEDPSEIAKRQRFSLTDFGLQPVEICLEAAGSDGRPAPPVFFWTPPGIRSANRKAANEDENVDEKVKAVQDKHLKALGYID